jgi:cytochrome c oxidase subunit II
LVVSLVLGAIGSAVVWLTPNWSGTAAAVQAGRVDTLYLVLMIISAFIMAIVVTFLVYSMIAFRRRLDDFSDGPPIHGHTALEIFWTAVPTLIVIGLAFYGAIVLYKNESVSSDRLVVDVTGRQFAWSFKYPAQDITPPFMVLPIGREVEFRIHGVEGDVIHSFYVPEFRVKQDAVPGIVTKTFATPTRRGTYPLICTELCGIGHSQMRSVVKVVSNAAFERWVSQERQSAQQSGGAS